MKYTVLTLFPEILDAYFASSIMAKALKRGILEYRPVNIRDFALDKHKTCDDAPYGGGPGMLMLAEPLGRALESAGVMPKTAGTGRPGMAGEMGSEDCEARGGLPPHVIYLSPSGRPFTQKRAAELARESELVLVCGRYEGIDQRVIDLYVDEELSVGDYVLSSGEVAALAIIDATYRLVDAVITAGSLDEESFSGGLLEYPQWTRPEIFGMMNVPGELLSGHHEQIRRWRLRERVRKTLANRPDLIAAGLAEGVFDAETVKIIEQEKSNERDKSH